MFGMFLLPSCQDWLELIPPDGLVKDEYWKTKEDVKATLMGAYQQLAQMDELLFLYGELRGDMIVKDRNIESYMERVMEGKIYPTNRLCNWSDFYSVINYCNNVIKYAPLVLERDQTFTEYQMRGFLAEATFLRSLTYFYLVRIFRDVPLFMEPSEEDDADFFLPKTADSIILKRIKEDLDQSLLFVTDDYGSAEANVGRATRAALLALLADISLWRFEYEDCISYVDRIEELDYQLLPGGNWFEVFHPGNSLEGIFELQFDDNLGQVNDLYDYTYRIDYFLASSNALSLLSPPLSQEIIRGNGSIRQIDSKLWKYSGGAADGKTLRTTSQQRSANWIVYRYADVLLMKAEALSQTGRYQESLDIINEIRVTRFVNPIPVSFNAEAMEDAIMRERATELAFEGKRWFDLLRLGRRNNYKRKEKLIETIIQNVPSTEKLVLASKLTDPYGWYLPIQEDELERNNNLVQNPYYESY